jgi:sugar/nucleoside kinase (ribokinase family)
MPLDVVGVGALNWDMLFEIPPEKFDLLNKDLESNRIAPLARGGEDSGKSEELWPTVKVIKKYGELVEERSGGSALNTIFALARIGFSTGYLGVIGHDIEGIYLRGELRNEGVDASRLLGALETGVYLVISDRHDQTRRVFPKSNDFLNLRSVDNEYFKGYLRESKIIHMTSFVCSSGYEPFEVQKKIAEELEKNVMISFGPGELYARWGLKKLQPILENTYVLFLNRPEMQILTGEDYKEGSKKLLEYGIRYVVTILGKDGAYLRYGDKEGDKEFLAELPSIPENEINAKGITGSGDRFVGGFLARLLMGQPPEYCMTLGNEVARIELRGLGREAYQKIKI